MGIEKKMDLPPKGRRNPDPITNEPGAHPIETGVGAAVGGAAVGLAVGAAAGPIGAAIGAAVGGIAGGYAGKAVGEKIDPTTEDAWLQENFASRPYVQAGEAFETYRPAYRYGADAEYKCGGDDFEMIEEDIESGWPESSGAPSMPWSRARGAVKDGYDRCVQIRDERDRQKSKTGKTPA
jgi:hypothetical protein